MFQADAQERLLHAEQQCQQQAAAQDRQLQALRQESESLAQQRASDEHQQQAHIVQLQEELQRLRAATSTAQVNNDLLQLPVQRTVLAPSRQRMFLGVLACQTFFSSSMLAHVAIVIK